jgi:hypothetical protein
MAKSPANSSPVVTMLPHQEELFWRDDLRRCAAIWRRQGRKSTTLANIALRRMMERKNHTCIFGSAAVLIGGEFLRKEVQTWKQFITAMHSLAAAQHLRAESNADDLDVDAACDLFEHSKLEVKIWHDKTSYSRSVVVACNPDTAVGWTGDIFLDEVGRIADYKDVLEAVLPFMDNNPEFILRMATTPPPDDTHYSWEYLVPPTEDFVVNPRGNWYRAQSGIWVHRADVFDTCAAGLALFDPDSGQPITPEEHRKKAFDKTAWDRNYACRFVRGGVAAISIAALQTAMLKGVITCSAENVTDEIVL